MTAYNIITGESVGKTRGVKRRQHQRRAVRKLNWAVIEIKESLNLIKPT